MVSSRGVPKANRRPIGMPIACTRSSASSPFVRGDNRGTHVRHTPVAIARPLPAQPGARHPFRNARDVFFGVQSVDLAATLEFPPKVTPRLGRLDVLILFVCLSLGASYAGAAHVALDPRFLS